MSGHVAAWLYFGIAWSFILLVLFKRWRARERREQIATEKALQNTRRATGHQYEMDAFQ